MSPRPGSLVAYLRVSTARQGASGLGLEAQRAAVQAFARANGQAIVAEFVEVESGKRDDRPQLAAALAVCRLHRATLCIAKLDRLARNVAFIANLMDCGDFVACDMPHANRLTLHIMSAMAEHERDMISQRTRAALAVVKARGVRLGNPNGAAALLAGCSEAARHSAIRRSKVAMDRAESLAPILAELRCAGCEAPTSLARELNRQGVPSPTGRVWYPEQVRRTIRLLASRAGVSGEQATSPKPNSAEACCRPSSP